MILAVWQWMKILEIIGQQQAREKWLGRITERLIRWKCVAWHENVETSVLDSSVCVCVCASLFGMLTFGNSRHWNPLKRIGNLDSCNFNEMDRSDGVRWSKHSARKWVAISLKHVHISHPSAQHKHINTYIQLLQYANELRKVWKL